MAGKVVASYLVRVTLHERDDLDEPERRDAAVPTLDEVTGYVKSALYTELDYFGDDEIGVSAERTDI